MPSPIPTRVAPSAAPVELSPRRVANEFRRRLDEGARLLPVGTARRRPRQLLSRGYTPRHRLDLFDASFYLSKVRQNADIRFFVAYVVLGGRRRNEVHPRLFYKDLSLIWRSASHFVRSANENWIGKGDIKITPVGPRGEEEIVESWESTTDLPLELQTALEDLSRGTRNIRTDREAVALLLRRGHDGRIQAYPDFTGPRRRAQSNPANLINRGRPVARFTRAGDPDSLRFTKGFEPDFREGVLEVSDSTSRLYGGELQRYRILSSNRKIQYLFMTGPRHVWIIPPQALTTELSTYGVRTVDVLADEDLFVPGFEYHGEDEGDFDGGLPQIPEGYMGERSEVDPTRADASPWLDALPVVKEFRRVVLGRRRR